MDVHLRTCQATVIDERGRILKREKFPNERLDFKRSLKGIDDVKVSSSDGHHC
ncbi:MAG: hypothetical protein ACUVQM_06805 [Candidatus Hadarchaeaceae archaeon]